MRAYTKRLTVPIDPEEFVRAWMAGESTEVMAERFKCEKSVIPQFAGMLRKKGVELPKRRPWEIKSKVDTDSLNSIIKNS